MSELDQLLREIDDLASRRDFAGMIALAERARAAVERGHQLWPAAEHAYYRVALHGPAPLAAHAVVESAGRFGFGPLTEVVAQHHTWAELAPHLPDGPLAATVAHERAIRGEPVDDHPFAEVPLTLAPWEPRYAVPVYHEHSIVDEPPALPESAPTPAPPQPPRAIDDALVGDALRELTRHWSTQSNGRTLIAAVDGTPLDAIAALGPRKIRTAPVSAAGALAQMAWAAATGAAAARRRGGAAGRFDAWWAACALAGLDWPPRSDDLGDALAELEWFAWDAYEPATGWRLQLAIGDPAEGLAWAISALDER